VKTAPWIKQRLSPHVRWMNRHDMPQVYQIERESFAQAWTEADFIRCLRDRKCYVAESAGKILGFMIYQLQECRLDLLNFAVAPESRRTGIGTRMLGRLIRKLSSHRRTRITVAVRESNLGAQLFFRMRDFRAVNVRRGHFEDTGEDAYLMLFKLDQESAGG
jgi:[ribosomal protein S18]-alanine N-acetyltransferase